MPKYKITNSYSDTVYYDEIVEIEADNEDDAIVKFHEGKPGEDYIFISKQEVDRTSGGWSEIGDLEEIE